jgi:hypothetical protein
VSMLVREPEEGEPREKEKGPWSTPGLGGRAQRERTMTAVLESEDKEKKTVKKEED